MSLTLTPSRQLPEVDAFIQCAMVMEAQPFLDALVPLPGSDAVETLVVGADGHHQQSYALGQLEGHTVVVITSGIGIANAAAAVARGLTLATPKIVIAGVPRAVLRVESKWATSRARSPRSTTMPMPPSLATSSARSRGCLLTITRRSARSTRSRASMMPSRIVTGDSFASEKVVARIRAGFPDALAVDMETCGMAQVCWSNGVDWICLRAISDLTGEGADEDFHMNGEKAAYHSFEAICAYLSLFCK